ncbi:MAG: SDR family oxidoreductase [Deltaproteobacteria bacterium]|nr:SDR family oxidoreductase [Deltaproteobacteria bacterium]
MAPFSKVLVTGGSGFIGSHLVNALVADGCDVTVLDNLATGHRKNLRSVKNRIAFIEGDICDSALVSDAARGCEVIFHQAAVVSVPLTVSDPVGSARVNELGTLHVLEAARTNQCRRVVLASSCAVYGDDPRLPKQEDMAAKPMSPYAVQKLTGEYYARLYHQLYGLETVSLRYFNVFGPRQDPSSAYSGVISIFMARAAKGQGPIIYGDGRQARDFIFVKDVVAANLLAAGCEKAAGSVFNIGTGCAIRIGELWDMIGRMAGVEATPTHQPSRAGDIRESLANIDQAHTIFGFSPEHVFEDGLARTFDWYRQSLL